VLIGVSYPEGAGFAVIAGHEGPSGEKLLDSTCAVAR
jgi:hypothetical protein